MIILVLVLLGLALGSFTNALVWRVHQKTARSLLTGRSMCSHCHQVLGFWDLVPVLSWLALKGKCRYCHKPISDTPLAELAVPALFVLSYIYWPLDWSKAGIAQFVVWLVILTGFMALTIYDMRWQLLPSRILYPVGVLALAQVLVLAVWQQNWQIALGAGLGALCLGGLFYALFQVSNGRWIGGGDVRLGVVIGLLVSGSVKAILVLFVASLLGTLVALPDMLTKKNQLTRRIAFGPFLIVASVIVYLFGASLVNWYRQRFLLL